MDEKSKQDEREAGKERAGGKGRRSAWGTPGGGGTKIRLSKAMGGTASGGMHMRAVQPWCTFALPRGSGLLWCVVVSTTLRDAPHATHPPGYTSRQTEAGRGATATRADRGQTAGGSARLPQPAAATNLLAAVPHSSARHGVQWECHRLG